MFVASTVPELPAFHWQLTTGNWQLSFASPDFQSYIPHVRQTQPPGSPVWVGQAGPDARRVDRGVASARPSEWRSRACAPPVTSDGLPTVLPGTLPFPIFLAMPAADPRGRCFFHISRMTLRSGRAAGPRLFTGIFACMFSVRRRIFTAVTSLTSDQSHRGQSSDERWRTDTRRRNWPMA